MNMDDLRVPSFMESPIIEAADQSAQAAAAESPAVADGICASQERDEAMVAGLKTGWFQALLVIDSRMLRRWRVNRKKKPSKCFDILLYQKSYLPN